MVRQKMRIKKLLLENFGPFRRYNIPFVNEEPACVLLTGKNNEGKSNIILALKLVSSACRTIGNRKMRIVIDREEFFKLPQQDTQGLEIGRILHNYDGDYAHIYATFENGFTVTVHFDEPEDLIYADYDGRIPLDSSNILGFIPPLGPLSETEDFLSLKYVRSSINTSLAPRHLRNHFAQILSAEEYSMVQDIVRTTWPTIKLLIYEHNLYENTLTCFFREGRIVRELAWAGQGLQVWFQIVTHLIRLRDMSVLVLDEPEINLHAEKQNDLIQVLRERHKGSVIIATHSPELMNNVDVSHIIHVQKTNRKPTIKKTSDRTYLDLVRSKVGSNFNLIASQFEKVDLILFTEDGGDYNIIRNLADEFGFNCNVFNIPLHGFSEYPKALSYRDAYHLLIGGTTPHTVVLDRDYYPEDHLKKVRATLKAGGVSVLFTPGKEIQNLFLSQKTLLHIITTEHHAEFESFWDNVYRTEKLDCYGSYLTLHKQFLSSKIDTKTVTKRFTPLFEATWGDKKQQHRIIGGKKAMHHLRAFYREKTGNNLTMQMIIKAVVSVNDADVRNFIGQALGMLPKRKQVLHY